MLNARRARGFALDGGVVVVCGRMALYIATAAVAGPEAEGVVFVARGALVVCGGRVLD